MHLLKIMHYALSIMHLLKIMNYALSIMHLLKIMHSKKRKVTRAR